MARGTGISERIVAYVQRRPGMHITAQEIQADLDETRQRTLSALSHILNRGILPGLVRHSTGVYVFRPDPTQAKSTARPSTVYEYVGSLKDGSSLVRDEVGKLYRIEEV